MKAAALGGRRITAGLIATACVAAGAVLVRAGDGGDRPRPPAESDSDVVSTTTSLPPRADAGRPDGQDEQGAALAAARYASASQRWLYQTDDEVRADVLAISTPEAGPALADLTVADVASARADLGTSPGPVWWVVHPLATRVVASSAGSAEVEVWAVTVLAAVEVAAPQSEWLTVTVDLAWTDDGWRVESIRDRPGPTPMLGPRDQPWDAAPFTAGLDGFDRLEGGLLEGEVPS